jgi:3-dehydroquinate dehydratase II
MKILVINGPNLNFLGKRNKRYYGKMTLDGIEKLVKIEYPSIEFTFAHSNSEGEIIDRIQDAPSKYDGIIINPGGYAHTSVAIRDALEDCSLPKIEVHISHLVNREDFRQNLITASVCDGYISGFKENSYLSAAYLLTKILNNKLKPAKKEG